MAISFDIDLESDRLDAEKPYVELIDGIELQKMSPQLQHALLQAELAFRLGLW